MRNPLAKKDQSGEGSPLKVISRSLGKKPKRKGSISLLILFFIIIGIAGLIYPLLSGKIASPIVVDAEGKEHLSPERQRKLDRELKEIENVEQYALIATADKFYPCYTCPDMAKRIFLKKGEVWKYGITRKGEGGRYPNQNYGAPDLAFVTQFQGTYGACLKMEKIKIYNYPLLPEAKKRPVRLFRPPGNAYDN